MIEGLEDYVVLEFDSVELHLNQATNRTAAEAFIHLTAYPTELRQRMSERAPAGVGPVEDQPWGLRALVTIDDNRLRIGHPTPCT